MATASELRSRVLRALARSSAPSNTQADVLAYMNAVVREICCIDRDWMFMRRRHPLVLVADQDTYAVPESYSGALKDIRMIELREGSTYEFHPLDEMTEEELHEGSVELSTGVPHCWGLKGDRTIMFRLIPDEAYECRVHTVEFPEPLTVSPDTENYITRTFSLLVEYGTIARMFAYFEQYQAATYWNQKFEEEKARALGSDRRTASPALAVLRQGQAAGSRVPRSRRGRRRTSWPVDYD